MFQQYIKKPYILLILDKIVLPRQILYTDGVIHKLKINLVYFYISEILPL